MSAGAVGGGVDGAWFALVFIALCEGFALGGGWFGWFFGLWLCCKSKQAGLIGVEAVGQAGPVLV